MELIDKNALSMELTNEVLNAYAKADFRFAHALNVFQGLIDKAPIVEERKHGHWEGAVLTTVLIATHMPQQMYLAAGWILLNSIIVIIAGLLWTVKLYVMIKE